MATSTGISPPASVFGEGGGISEGVVSVKGAGVNFPGGLIFGTNNAGVIQHMFMWFDTTRALRVITADSGAVIYDQGTNQITFTAFDQDVAGTVIS